MVVEVNCGWKVNIWTGKRDGVCRISRYPLWRLAELAPLSSFQDDGLQPTSIFFTKKSEKLFRFKQDRRRLLVDWCKPFWMFKLLRHLRSLVRCYATRDSNTNRREIEGRELSLQKKCGVLEVGNLACVLKFFEYFV
jgi:hypothetical protein